MYLRLSSTQLLKANPSMDTSQTQAKLAPARPAGTVARRPIPTAFPQHADDQSELLRVLLMSTFSSCRFNAVQKKTLFLLLRTNTLRHPPPATPFPTCTLRSNESFLRPDPRPPSQHRTTAPARTQAPESQIEFQRQGPNYY